MYARVALHLAYERPVGLSGVHLAACAAVDGERLYAAVLQLLSQLGDDEVVAVPSKSGLDRHGHVDRLDHLARDFEHERHIAQHAGSGTFARHFLDGASEVDVYHVGLGLFHDLGSLDHRGGVSAVNLYAHGPFFVVEHHLVERGAYRADDGLCRYELGIYHGGAKPLAEHAEAYVGDVFHRRQKEWACAQVYISYFHNLLI